MTLTVSEHGGRCCGIYHLSGLSTAWSNKNREATKLQLSKESLSEGLLHEITMTSRQISDLEGLYDHLIENGWRNVSQFRNRNSGSDVHVLHFYKEA